MERLTYFYAFVASQILYHFDQFGQSLGFLIFQEIPENLKIFETFKSGVRKNRVGQGTAELNEMVQYAMDDLIRSLSEVFCACPITKVFW